MLTPWSQPATLVGPFLVLISYAQIIVPDVPADYLLNQSFRTDYERKSSCQQACASLASQLSHAVFIGQTGNFELWDAKQAELVPACRVEPSNATEVSSVLKTVIKHDCHFAVKGGGHDRTPGSSNADGGVTIDMVRMNGIRLTNDRKSVTVEAGLRWFEVYETLEKSGLTVLGGRIGDVGVSGLLLGGGISFYSNEHGLACDSIISYEIVLPNTTITTIDRRSSPELYRALRGAGAANFGIVTAFKLETLALTDSKGEIWSGTKFFDWGELPQLLEANKKVASTKMDQDVAMAVMQIFVCQTRHDLCFGVIQAQHTNHRSSSSTDQQWPEFFDDYAQIHGIPHTTETYMATMSNITARLADSSAPGQHRVIYGTFSYTPSVSFEVKLLEIFHNEQRHLGDVTGFLPGIIMHPFSANMLAHTRKNGGNAIGSLQSHRGPLVVCNVAWQWREKLDDERTYAAYHRLISRAEELAKDMGVWHPYKYINYAEASQAVFEGYGEESLLRLRQVQREIDPDGIFARGGLAGGSFKLNGKNIKNDDDVLQTMFDTEESRASVQKDEL